MATKKLLNRTRIEQSDRTGTRLSLQKTKPNPSPAAPDLTFVTATPPSPPEASDLSRSSRRQPRRVPRISLPAASPSSLEAG
ncbi:hypothetical protein PIB30_060433 [Stylosanthes scabra]|uniref:Uncharacterized protein n=1 Tax=Stylosanthes scabra TaxID=79078 RepID=A0ABU6UM71_9FABA|nr:hypothetical protein [Stylosanthes scabra]